jgi:hypothetical protein
MWRGGCATVEEGRFWMTPKSEETLQRFNRRGGGTTATLVVGWLLGLIANLLVLSALQDVFAAPQGARMRPMHVVFAMAAAAPLGLIGAVCAMRAWWRPSWLKTLSFLGFALGLMPVPLGVLSLHFMASWKGLVYLP